MSPAQYYFAIDGMRIKDLAIEAGYMVLVENVPAVEVGELKNLTPQRIGQLVKSIKDNYEKRVKLCELVHVEALVLPDDVEKILNMEDKALTQARKDIDELL